MALDLYHPGLHGVIAGETNISSLDHGLIYRGYCVHDLAEESNFLEVCYLLLHEELPSEEELADFRSILVEEMELPEPVTAVLENLPLHVTPLEALRTGVSLLSHFDPQTNDGPLQGGIGQAVRLLARIPLLIATWHHLRTGEKPPEPATHLGYAGNLFYLITGREPPVLFERALDSALIAAAEHEFNPSTYAARMVGSTGGDLYAAVTAALGVLAGSKHGGGDDRVLDLIALVKTPDQAVEWAQKACKSSDAIPGFGHPVYKDCDRGRRCWRRTVPNWRWPAVASGRKRRLTPSSGLSGKRRSCRRTSTGRCRGCCTISACRVSCTCRSSQRPASSGGVPT